MQPLSSKEKLTIVREFEATPGVAFLNMFERLRTEFAALLSHEIENIKSENETAFQKIEEIVTGISDSLVINHDDIKATVEEINQREIDEDAIVEGLANKIEIPPSEPGTDGVTPSDERLLALIRPLMPKAKNGTTPSNEKLLSLIRPLLPDPAEGIAPTDEELLALIQPLIPKIEPSEVEKIVRQVISDPTFKIDASKVTNLKTTKAKKYLHGGGSSSAGFSKLTPTGTVDGANTTFVFASAPTLITVDQGRAMQQTSSDGTINWTGTTTVVLAIAPVFDIYGL